MQTIQLRRFGKVLVTRPAGQEAFNAIRPELDPNAEIWVDFEGVLTVSPSWFDEFLKNLTSFNHGKVELLPTNNASVLATLPVLAEARDDLVADTVKRALERFGN